MLNGIDPKANESSTDLATFEEFYGPTAPIEEITGDLDFIREYVDYADVLEVPPEAHEAVALLMLAVALNNNVFLMHGSKRVNLDVWLLLLSESSMGRNYLVDDIARPLLDKAGLASLVHNAVWGSPQALYQQIATQPVGLYIWPELSVILKKLQDPRFAGAQQWLTDLKDSNTIPDAVRYRTTGRPSNTPPIVFSQAPRIGILSTSSTDWFLGNLKQEDSTGGFIPRWTIVFLPKSDRVIPFPRATDASKLDVLAEHLRAVNELNGEADLSGCGDLYGEWYRAAKKRFEDHANPALAGPFFRRLRTQLLQFAVIFQASQYPSLIVSRKAMERAIQIAAKIESGIFRLLPTGMTREGHEIERMADLARSKGSRGINKSAVTMAFKHWRPRDRKDRLETLIESGTIVEFTRRTSGRHARVFVHADHLAEHAKLYPDDRITFK
jgi:hypothetical protein